MTTRCRAVCLNRISTKRLSIVIGLILLPTIAFAQQPTPPKEFDFKLTDGDLNIISKGLQTVPFGEAAPVMTKMQQQYVAQQPKKEPEKPVDKPADKPVEKR